jgi:hypothetical protein
MLKASLLLTVVLGSLAQAQVVYTPVQHEYGTGNDRYYYGGSDPRVHERAARDAAARAVRGVANSLPQVYSDALPHQPNAAVYGVNASDARNQAYDSVPRYFRKRDMVGRVEVDGSITVPPTAPQVIDAKPVMKPVASPTTKPGVIIIIPKAKPSTPVASAS